MIDRLAVVVDVETLSLRPDATVLELAACAIDLRTGKILSTIYLPFNKENQGGHQEEGTIDWVLDNIPDAIVAGLGVDNVVQMRKYFDWVKHIVNDPDRVSAEFGVYGNGATFDHPIIHMLVKRVLGDDASMPQPFFTELCARTFINTAFDYQGKKEASTRAISKVVSTEGFYKKHLPLHDVLFEAHMMHMAYVRLDYHLSNRSWSEEIFRWIKRKCS